MVCHLRVIFVNDVYLLDNLPRFKTAIVCVAFHL